MPPFDIYRVSDEDESRWIDAALTLNDAIARVRQIGASLSGSYLIHSPTGAEIYITIRPSAKLGFAITPRDKQNEK
jgi:hypothetical protein